jgi:hypothetical protein
MSAQCISCRRFTVKHRTQHERSDKAMRAQGFGRCALADMPGQYVSAVAQRPCDKHDPIQPDQVQQRQAYLAKQHQIYLTTP